ncbi:MAG: hypothetical protein GBAus27B_000259 [Mycoplasmataceae bacterium]|nr:MAG: hypothetical protein GBAus27B_000259 [Mycoplasmataceae bacterium]
MNAHLFSDGQTYFHYSLKRPIIVNKKIINEIIIWSHFEDKHASYIKKEMMLKFAMELDRTDYPVEKQGFREDGRTWSKYNYDKFYEDKKAYRLFWYLEEGRKSLWVIHCLRHRKNDKK